MRIFRTLIILSHRYIGIPLSFMFVVWFLSAFVMIYAGGMPRITPEMRVEGAAPLDFAKVAVSPQQAVSIAGFSPVSATLKTVLGRPVYEFGDRDFGSTFVYADNGDVLADVDELDARQIASNFLEIPASQFSFEGVIDKVDQWTLTSRRQLPLYKFVAGDDLGTVAYVSGQNAQLTVYTTSQSRMLAWLGTIPHWLYFTALRTNQPLWYDLVVWSSGIGCVLALFGLFLGVTQFRKVRPFNLSRSIPYRGWMRWHYILGVIFGVFTLTWAFSGMLSMEPFSWSNTQGLYVDRDVYREGELSVAAFPAFDEEQWSTVVDGDIKEIEFSWIQGQPYFSANYSARSGLDNVKRERLHQPYYVTNQAESNSVLIAASSFTVVEGFDVESLVSKLSSSVTDANVVNYELLAEYDNYYYSRNNQIPLPVLRVVFDDPAASWVYIDPKQSQVLTLVHKWSRIERWLYNGLHSLDFAFWYHKRPLWDIGVIILLLGGLISSGIGLAFGLKRLKNDIKFILAKLISLKNSRKAASIAE